MIRQIPTVKSHDSSANLVLHAWGKIRPLALNLWGQIRPARKLWQALSAGSLGLDFGRFTAR